MIWVTRFNHKEKRWAIFREREGERQDECDRKWFVNVRVHHQKAPVTTSHEWRNLKADGHENAVRTQSCREWVCVCRAVVIRICSNHIHPLLFSQTETTHTHTHTHTHTGFHDVSAGKTTGLLQLLRWLKLFLQNQTDSWFLQQSSALTSTVNPAAT